MYDIEIREGKERCRSTQARWRRKQFKGFLDGYPIEYVYLYIGSNTHFGESSMTKRGLGSILTVNDKYMYTYRTYVVRVAC